MIVAFDIQAAVDQRAGIAQYTRELAKYLVTASGVDELELRCFRCWRQDGLGSWGPDVGMPSVTRRPFRLVRLAWKGLGYPLYDSLTGSADVFHFPDFVVPPLGKGRVIATIHDLAYLKHPDTVEKKNLAYLRKYVPLTVARANRIITHSKVVADEIREAFRLSESAVEVVYPGVSVKRVHVSKEKVAEFRKWCGIEVERPYLLAVGTLEPRKNYPFLVSVFEGLRGFDGDLVIIGDLGWKKCESILKRIEGSSRSSRIKTPGYVPEDLLPAAYSGAELFLCCSLYEGFGFPPLEAMAYGTPVISSNGGALRETLEGGALLMKGHDLDDWTSVVENLIQDTAKRHRLRAQGLQRAADFDWVRTAERMWRIYRAVLAESSG